MIVLMIAPQREPLTDNRALLAVLHSWVGSPKNLCTQERAASSDGFQLLADQKDGWRPAPPNQHHHRDLFKDSACANQLI